MKDIGFDLHLNQWVYWEGSNGCGKTTLLKIIQGLLSPDQGELRWCRKTFLWKNVFRDLKTYIHPVFQDSFHSLNPRLSICKSLDEVIRRAPREKRGLIEKMRRYFWRQLLLKDSLYHLFPHQLSYGQQKRVSLLRTLLKYQIHHLLDPRAFHIFLFDEVFAGIHWDLREKILFFLQTMRKDKVFSIIWVAHGHEVLKELCDRVCCLDSGVLAEI